MEPGRPEEPSIGQIPNSVLAPPQELHADDFVPATFFDPNPGEHLQPSLALLALHFVVRSPWRP